MMSEINGACGKNYRNREIIASRSLSFTASRRQQILAFSSKCEN
jgi:hypothetical protein